MRPQEDRSVHCMDKLIYLLDQAESACDQYRRRLEDVENLLAERTRKLKSLRAANQTMRRNFRLRNKI